MEFFFCFILTTCITTFLYFVSYIFCFMNGCLWWIHFINIWWHLLSHNRRSIFDIIIDPNPKERPKNTPQVICVRGKQYSSVVSEGFHGSWQKEKYNQWYLKYKVLNENWIFRTKHPTKRQNRSCDSLLGHLDAHLILSRLFLVYILLYSLAVLWYISLQEFLATNLD